MIFKGSVREKLKGGIGLRRIKTGTINYKFKVGLGFRNHSTSMMFRVEIKFAEDNNTWIENIVFAIQNPRNSYSQLLKKIYIMKNQLYTNASKIIDDYM